MAHAKFGSPSGMYALKACPAKLFVSKGLKDVPESEYSKEGTRFHMMIEHVLDAALNGKAFASMILKFPEYPDMHHHVQDNAKKAADLWKKFKAKHDKSNFYIEFRATLDKKMDIWGTSDVVFVGTNKKTGKVDVLILDWKYGQGVIVKAHENLQGITYALGTLKTLGIPYSAVGSAMLIVAQMRLEDGWSDYVMKASELPTWEKMIKDIVILGKKIYDGEVSPEDHINPGEHCRFCPANYWNTCNARKELVYNEVILGATEFEMTPEVIQNKITAMTLDQKVELYLKKSVIEDILDANAADLNRLLSLGVKHPKVKIVQKRGNRKWKYKDDVIVKKLQAMGYKKPFKKPGVVGIVDAEAVLGKAKIAKLVVKGEGKKEVVRAGDYRAEIEIDEPEELD